MFAFRFRFRLPPQVLVFALCNHAIGVFAAAPSLKGVFPPGAMRGTEVEVTLEGKPEKGQVWIEGAGVTFSAPDDKGKSKAVIASDAVPGIRLLRVFNAEGVSEAARFVVGTVPEVVEAKPNLSPTQAHVLEKLPVCVNGRIDKAGDLDHFAFTLKKGQTVRIELLAYTLGSPIDPLMHVLDENGTRLATASDARNLDPALTFTAPAEGRYTVQIAGFTHPPAADVNFTGGSTVVYRLMLHPGPLTTGLFPAAVSSTSTTRLTRRGFGLTKDKLAHEMPASPLPAYGRLTSLSIPDSQLPIDVLVTQAITHAEVEPNDVADKATKATALPAVFGGTIHKRGDSDRFVIPVKKGQKLRAEVFSQRLGLPLDAALMVMDEAGKSLGSAEDQKDDGDPVLNWTAAADGMHQVVVTDQFHRGGEGHDYVVEIREVAPAFEATLADGKPLKVVRGKKVELKVNVKLLARVIGLPPTLTVKEVPVPAKGGDVTVAIEPPADFAAGTHPFSVVIATADGNASQSQTATFDLRGDNRRGTSQSDREETLWLTVTEK
jgi:hypothetical protein